MKAVIRLEPCSACIRDPGFGRVHMGCTHCKRELAEREKQPPLTRVSEIPLVYAERGAAKVGGEGGDDGR